MRMRRQRFVSASERALDIEMDSWDVSDERRDGNFYHLPYLITISSISNYLDI